MKSLRTENNSTEGEPLAPRFRILPEIAGRVRLEVSFEIPSDLSYVSPAGGYFSQLAREHGYPESIWAENLPLAMDEAVTNAIRHGHNMDASKIIRISGILSQDKLEIRVEDEGEGFDPDSLPDPREGDSLYRSNGRGVFLIRTLSDELLYEKGGRHLTMVFNKELEKS
jgi:serine/threonine-protein kinase RsbW